jgi:hypothetical protein
MPATVEPAKIVVFCADAGVVVQDLKWSSWKRSGAVGIGMVVYQTCTPTCAAGGYGHLKGATITLTDPVAATDGKQVWSKIRIAPAPPGSDGVYPLATKPS